LETPSTRILVVEDYEPIRRFICSMLRKRPGFQIVEVTDGLEAVQKAGELQPDLIMLDIGLPSLNGIDAARRIRKLFPKTRILFVSQESSAVVVQEALALGARGYVVKAHAGSELLAAVEAVLQGRQFVSSGLSGHYSPPRRIRKLSTAPMSRSHHLHWEEWRSLPATRFSSILMTQLFFLAPLVGDRDIDLLLPYSVEAQALSVDIELVQYVAQAVLEMRLEAARYERCTENRKLARTNGISAGQSVSGTQDSANRSWRSSCAQYRAHQCRAGSGICVNGLRLQASRVDQRNLRACRLSPFDL
jgi:DNA-binding NarL/FixJ family response regulator